MKLVHFPESPDPRFRIYLDFPKEGCIYTLEGGALIQYLRHRDGSLGSGGAVSSDGVEEEAAPFIDEVAALLRDAGHRLPRLEVLIAEYKRTSEDPGGRPASFSIDAYGPSGIDYGPGGLSRSEAIGYLAFRLTELGRGDDAAALSPPPEHPSWHAYAEATIEAAEKRPLVRHKAPVGAEVGCMVTRSLLV